MNRDTFDILFLVARPAAGKSEIVDFLKRTKEQERAVRFYVGEFVELDDFPMLWAWFEEDRILTDMGYPRLHTDDQEHFAYPYLWNVLIRRLALEYQKLMRDREDDKDLTTIVEFSRGSSHGGYWEAFQHFPEEMLQRGAIMYIQVSWEESLRKNRRRFNPDKPDSVLEHGLPDTKLEQLYRHTDWDAFVSDDPEYVNVNGIPVPYFVFENEDDVTTARGERLGQRLEQVLGDLWVLYSRGR
jgi:hypothetical protein